MAEEETCIDEVMRLKADEENQSRLKAIEEAHTAD